MVCYRRYGHNEGDEPAFTQPRMYEVIGERRSVRKLYTEQLVNRGDLTLEEAEQALEDFRARLEAAFDETHDVGARPSRAGRPPSRAASAAPSHVDTGVPRERLEHDRRRAHDVPRRLPRRTRSSSASSATARTEFDGDQVDWALAEALAFGSLLLEGTPVRLAGQDTRRGTFSQRHARARRPPRPSTSTRRSRTSADDQAPFMIYDSVLSEFAALGFEYGYSVADRDALVCWEAQFGDFVNGAQTIIDQFIVAAEDKWGQRSGLVLLLPHGFEGQGPEHSSAPARALPRAVRRGQHARRVPDHRRAVLPRAAPPGARPDAQAARSCITPKRYLRMPATVLAGRGVHRRRLPARARRPRRARSRDGHAARLLHRQDRPRADRPARRDAARRSRSCGSSSSTRGPSARSPAELARYPNAEVVWAQEEPGNMGARYFARRRIEEMAGGRPVGVVARPASPSPATGSSTVHDAEQAPCSTPAISAAH